MSQVFPALDGADTMLHDRVCLKARRRGSMKRLSWVVAATCGLVTMGGWAQSTPAIFRGADLVLGERLIGEHRCTECHSTKVPGDGSVIYRPNGRINTPGLLRGMVEQCNTQMSLGMFPEDVTAVAAVLNRDHYRFK